jgi:hypothetical protein
VEGELRALVRVWNWGKGNLELLEEILAELVRVDAGLPDVVKGYGEIYAADQAGGHNTGQNDMWIEVPGPKRPRQRLCQPSGPKTDCVVERCLPTITGSNPNGNADGIQN